MKPKTSYNGAQWRGFVAATWLMHTTSIHSELCWLRWRGCPIVIVCTTTDDNKSSGMVSLHIVNMTRIVLQPCSRTARSGVGLAARATQRPAPACRMHIPSAVQHVNGSPSDPQSQQAPDMQRDVNMVHARNTLQKQLLIPEPPRNLWLAAVKPPMYTVAYVPILVCYSTTHAAAVHQHCHRWEPPWPLTCPAACRRHACCSCASPPPLSSRGSTPGTDRLLHIFSWVSCTYDVHSFHVIVCMP